MKIQAIMMMKNDVIRMQFVLDHFFKWNPDIPVLIYNCGGISPSKQLEKYSNVKLINYDDIWHKRGPNGIGSFDPRWFKLLFDYGLNKEYTHTLFLETDVLTTKKISIEPKYDMSGILNYCGNGETDLYNMFNLTFKQHSGCGSTIYKNEFFEKSKNNLEIVNYIYMKKPQSFFQDLVITILGRISDCSYGHWEECSDVRGYWSPDTNNELSYKPSSDYSTTFIHSVKV